MDLIYMNSSKEDVGVLLDYELDMAFGKDENNFECKLQANAHCCEAGYFLYMEGTEYGGIVDGIRNDTANSEVTYSGRTWHGILNSKVIQPDSGKAYLTVSGEANAVIGALLERMTLTSLFQASTEVSGLTISSYQMPRYIAGYDGISKMLDTVGAKLKFTFSGGMVILSAVPKYNYANDEEFDSDLVDFKIQKNYKTVNHLICLGSGELENRMVIHLYADASGNISRTQTLFGADEHAAVFNYSNVESEEELIKEGTAELLALWEQNKLEINFGDDSDSYDVGDVVGAYDNVTNISVIATITKKIVAIQDGYITISYEVGE